MANRFRKRTNKLDMEHILVGTGDSVLADGTANGTVAVPTAGLVNTSTAYGIANGQLGVMNVDGDSPTLAYGDFLTAGDTIDDANEIQLIQGTPLSNRTHLVNGFEAGDKGVMKSSTIRAGFIRSVTTETCEIGTYSSEYYTGFAAPLDLSQYSIRVDMDSVRNDRDFGDNDEVVSNFFITPEYSDAAVSAIILNPLDHLLQNLAVGINLQSKLTTVASGGNRFGNRNFVVFGINSAGGAGQVLGTITDGTTIPVMTDTSANLNYVADQVFVNTVNTWIANGVPATATIELMDLSTAGLVAAPTGIDGFIVMGLDEDQSLAFDNIKMVRTRVIPTLGDAFLLFPAPTKVTGAMAVESKGLGRDWTIENDNRARLAIHNMQNHPHGEFYIEGTTYVDPNVNYTSTIIDYYDYEESLTQDRQTPKQAIILLECAITNPAADAATGYTIATSDATTVADLNAILSVWLDSERAVSNHDVKGLATPGTYFV